MSFNFGRKLKISLFGQSHAPAIGVVIDGLPSGREIDFDEVNRSMARRAPGGSTLTTPRKENDQPKVLSGIVNGKTCGAPLCLMIENTDVRSKDYDKLRDVPRPMHADFPAAVKYHGSNDIRGGGQFSGRLTAPLCAAGAICAQLLQEQGISIGSHLAEIGGVEDDRFDAVGVTAELLQDLSKKAFPVLNEDSGARMRSSIEAARDARDSVGGIVECAAVGLPVGLGEHMFDGVENWLAHAIFGIPGVRGVEFGAGFASARMSGSEHNDAFTVDETGNFKTKTNRLGGVLGGMTSGMPLIFSVAFKPTSSIGLTQESVSLSRKENVSLVIEGRHDPCIVIRAFAVVEAVTAIVLYDLILVEGLDGNR